jgi:hypothetical protein
MVPNRIGDDECDVIVSARHQVEEGFLQAQQPLTASQADDSGGGCKS